MIIRVYSKYTEDAGGQKDGKNIDAVCRGIMEKKKEFLAKLRQNPYPKKKVTATIT
jgi:hypothetical protein